MKINTIIFVFLFILVIYTLPMFMNEVGWGCTLDDVHPNTISIEEIEYWVVNHDCNNKVVFVIPFYESESIFNHKEWVNTIDACEVFEPYLTPMHRYLYDQIILDDFCNMFRGAGKFYNLIIMGDCLEHVDKQEGIETVQRFREYCEHLIISVSGNSRQAEFGNPAERHLAQWSEEDFKELGGECDVKQTGLLITAHYTQKRV